ncbi:MAG: hypothetical protein RL562_1992 [Planctomycetota bacterium]|jgi:hypothetical protein
MSSLIRPLSLALFLLPQALAQQPDLDVSDLVQRSGLDPAPAGMVRRGLPKFASNWAEVDRRRLLLGEERLVAVRADGQEAAAAAPLLERDALLALLDAIRGENAGATGFVEVGPRVLLDSGFAEQAAVDLRAVRDAMPPRIELDVTVERVGADGTTEVLLRGVEAFRSGEVRVIADAIQNRVLYGLEVEIAQSSAIYKPLFDVAEIGVAAALRARVLPDGTAAIVEAVVRSTAENGADSIAVGDSVGPLDRLATVVDELGSTFVVAQGGTVVQELGTLGGAQLRLRCTARYEPPKSRLRSDLRVIATPLFGSPVVGFRFMTRSDDGLEADALPSLGVQELAVRAIGEQSDAFALFLPPGAGSTGVLVLNGERGERIGRSVEQRVTGVLRPEQLSIEVWSLPIGVEVRTDADGPVPEGAEALVGFQGSVVAGLPVAFGSGIERSYVFDWETEVAQASRVPRPLVGLFDEGSFATAWVQPGAAGRVGLELDVDRLIEMRSREVGLGREMAVILDTSNPLVLPAENVAAEMPRTGAARIRTVVATGPDGGAVVRRAARAALGEGRELVIRVRLR